MKAPNSNHFTGKKMFQTPCRKFGKKKAKGHIKTNMLYFQEVKKLVKSLSLAQVEWVYQKWCEGYSQAQLAEALYVSVGVIQRAINGRPRVRESLKCPYL